LLSRTFRLTAIFVLLITLMTIAESQSAPARPPITGVSHIAFYAKDPAASHHFYYDLLRLTPHPTRANVYLVGTRQSIEIEPMPSAPVQNMIKHLAFATPDAEGMRAYLASKGVKVPSAVSVGGPNKWFEFEDPEGHPLEFVQEQPWALPETAASERPASARLIHGGFTVKDRAKMDAFYGGILGFKLYWQGGFKDGVTDWVDMQVPDGTDWLEYMLENRDGKADARLLGILNHAALGTADFEGTVELLKTRGYVPTEETKPQLGLDGKRQINLYDPDGTRVEIMDFAPHGKVCCSAYTGPHPQ
jgi:catechol 2,3-dioxygenase-like lactoylglutathione lyase family enzyme